MHSWYQMILGSNESLYAWMDEGFTDYSSTRAMATMRNSPGFWYNGSYGGYYRLARSAYEEPASTHADHFNTNFASTSSAYFFFQAEDGIRDWSVTGVQTCALPIIRHTRLVSDWSSDVCSSDHTSELQSLTNLVCRLLLETKEQTPKLQTRTHVVCRSLP